MTVQKEHTPGSPLVSLRRPIKQWDPSITSPIICVTQFSRCKYDAIADVVLSPCAVNFNAIEDHPWWNTCPITIDMLNYRAGFTIVEAGLMNSVDVHVE
jgi:hypothetical protein